MSTFGEAKVVARCIPYDLFTTVVHSIWSRVFHKNRVVGRVSLLLLIILILFGVGLFT